MPSKFKPTRVRKRKVLGRQSQAQATSEKNNDSNATIITISKSEKEARREQLRKELRAQQPKVSAQKQKRLDKYIDKKLKKEENLDLIKKLAAEREKYDVSGLQSSSRLNGKSGKKRTFEDFVDGQVNAPEATVVVQQVKQDGKSARKGAPIHEDKDSDNASVDSFEEEHKEAFETQEEPATDDTWLKSRAPPVQGTGLAQPLSIGPDGLPIIPVRSGKRRKEKAFTQPVLGRQKDETSKETNGHSVDQQDVPWEGFSDEEEAGDVDSGFEVNEPDSEGDEDDTEEDVDSRLKGIDSNVLDALLKELERSDASNDEEDATSANDVSTDEEEDSGAEGNSSEAESQDESDTEASSEPSDDSPQDTKSTPRQSAFKSWATQQLNHSLGHVPSYDQPQTQVQTNIEKPPPIKPAAGYRLGIDKIDVPKSARLAYTVHIERPESIQEPRSHLPILHHEQEIMEAVYNNPVVVVKGDTGSGKTTQLPQFLLEAGFGDKKGPTPGMIGITQPRRVAAVSMAKRVAEELGSHGGRVAHQIRFDTTVSSETAIKFMTDGILLRELSQDLLLKKYSAIVIDEAHERSVNTDLLIGMLSKIVPARMKKTEQNPDPKPLKLIIMSATLNINDFLHEKLFSVSMRPPVVQAEGRQHRVTTHFASRSRPDYLEEIVEKVKRAHRKLPRGGILVFLTGQNEIKHVISCIRKDLTRSARPMEENVPRMYISAADAPLEPEDLDIGAIDRTPIQADDNDDIDILADEEEADKEFEISDEEEEGQAAASTVSTESRVSREPYDTVHLLPLYSQLPTNEQLRIFEAPPDRARLIVVATNVAETSLTIPGIRYVFDCGRSKERKYDTETNVQTFEIDYISKASAQQRAGRAGRTAPGHCWRLYSSAVYEQFFLDHTEPEMLRTPAESIVLQLKGFRYPRPVTEFPFPSPPSRTMLQKAEKLLRNLGAIAGSTGAITELGKQLSLYPLSPRLGRIVVNAISAPKAIAHVLMLTAALSVDDIFINETQLDLKVKGRQEGEVYTHDDHQADNERERLKQQYGRAHAMFSKHDKQSDALKTLTAVHMYLEAPDRNSFCQHNFLRPKAMLEIAQLIAQLRNMVQGSHPTLTIKDNKQATSKYSASAIKALNNIVASGYIDQIALRYDLHPTPPTLPTRPTRSIDVPYLPLMPLTTHPADLVDRAIFIHPSSLLSRSSVKSLPEYIVYRHLQTSQPHTVASDADSAASRPKTRMFPLCPLDTQSLLSLVRDTGLIEYGKPVPKTKVEELHNTRPKERICWVSAVIKDSDGSVNGSLGWPLPPSRVRQIMDLKSPTGWRVVEVLA